MSVGLIAPPASWQLSDHGAGAGFRVRLDVVRSRLSQHE
jgi:hypothetical protein